MAEPDPVAHIWRPKVEPIEAHLPRAGQTTGWRRQVDSRVTKTSLKLTDNHHNQPDDEATLRRRREALNSEIIKVSQSFNSSPRPFLRQKTSPSSGIARQLARADFNRSNTTLNRSPDMAATHNQHQQQPPPQHKLVHNLYNSPLNLYSMNNIRDTIEAHSELIAPGVKGINFNKFDNAPVNKQSEVYKLVMEEERQQHQSPQRQQAVHSPAGSSHSPAGPTWPVVNQARQQQHQQSPAGSLPANASQLGRPVQYASEQNYGAEQAGRAVGYDQATGDNKLEVPPLASQQPKCGECGLLIVGPFAKVQSRFVHPQCFNCATCGTSLKNSGYFTISEKLYCEIHAKQVANLMRLNYNFDANSQRAAPIATTMTSQGSVGRPEFAAKPAQASLTRAATLAGSGQAAATTTARPQATISTMFSNLSQREQRQVEPQHVQHWTWREEAGRATFGASQTMTKVIHESEAAGAASSVGGRHGPAASLDLSGTTNGGANSLLGQQSKLNQEAPARPGQDCVPVCCKCSRPVRGPYVLAGTRTMCKACSQRLFVCSACNRSLLDVGFVELEPGDANPAGSYCCEPCFNQHYASSCAKCSQKIGAGLCLNALGKHWHPECFVCGHCRQSFGNSLFYLEDGLPYCQRDWNLLFTSKCHECAQPIGAGDRWIEALDRNYHLDCFRCSTCRVKLEGSTFYCKNGKPICKLHAKQ